ncbi:MAG: site-2 protease family protein [Candidatus Dormibacteraeota bacterium]|nr:site-2 protease family protein [Candidatus Dormibacteraeota bacterium]
MSVVIGVAAIVAMFLILVVPHEFGHFVLAKAFGIKVHEFSLGIGGKLASMTRGGTMYAVRALPVAGYVRLSGMEPGDFADPDGFHHKAPAKRLLVLLGGALANFVVAALLVTGVTASQINSDPGFIAQVVAGSPAAHAGLVPGDRIRSVNGSPLQTSHDLLQTEQAHPGQPLQLAVHRADGSTFETTLKPRYNSQDSRYEIGVQALRVVTPLDAVKTGVTFPVYAVGFIVSGLGQVVTGRVPGGLLGPEGATGAIGMGALTYQAANQGLLTYLTLVALLSVALGVTNLLPLPALDGGRILVVLLEVVRRKPFDREREMAVQRYGLAAMLALMVLIAVFDVQRLVTGQFPGLR